MDKRTDTEDGAMDTASSLPTHPSMSNDSDSLVKELMLVFTQQAREARSREERLAGLLERVIGQPRSDLVNGDQHPVSERGLSLNRTDCPTLSSTSSLAEFAAWKETWQDLYHCKRLKTWDRATQLSALRSCLDEELRRYIRESIIDVDSDPTVETLILAVERYLRNQRNPLLDRLEFYRLQQDNGETFNSFFTTLKEHYKACAFQDRALCSTCQGRITDCHLCHGRLLTHEEETLRDRIITGIADSGTRRKLLAEPELTLQKAVEICRAEETADTTQQTIDSTPPERLQAVRRSNYQRTKSQLRNTESSHSQKSTPPVELCPQCGYRRHQDKLKCPARGKECNLCGKIGHFQRVCRTREATPKDKASLLSLRVSRVQGSETVKLKTTLQVQADRGGEPRSVSWLPDTGSDVNAIGPDTLHTLGGDITDLSPDTLTVTSADGKVIKSLGKAHASLEHQDRTHRTELHVYADITDPLLSRDSLKALQFLPSTWPHNTVIARATADDDYAPSNPSIEEQRASLLAEFADVFSEQSLQPMNGEPMRIELQENAKPFCINAARTIPYGFRDQIQSQLDDMVRDNIIEPVTEPSEWCHPIVVVDKRDTDEKRMTVDLTRLNRQVKRPVHPSRSVKDAIANINGAKYFTLLDARHGYWQVPLAEESRALTTFLTPWGRYRYLRNPQGFIGAGDEFNRRMDAAFSGLSNFAKVVDDCIIYDNDLSTHKSRVRQVLQQARKHGITLSPRKFVFAQPEVRFCGVVLNADGWHMDNDKLRAIKEFPAPQNITDLRSFMGLVNQFTEFSCSLARIAEPLRALLSPSNEFQWLDQHTEIMNSVKEELLQAPTLAFYQFGVPTRLETDASRQGIGFALLQYQDDHWRLIHCGSRFITGAESRYAMIELECLAAVWAMKKCYNFLAGVEFDLVTDHKPLVPIFNSYTLDMIENPRLLRLLLKSRRFQFSAHWRRGKEHFIADALSRYPVEHPDGNENNEESGKLFNLSVQHGKDDSGSPILPDMKHDRLLQAAADDHEYQALLNVIEHGFPSDQSALPNMLRPYWQIRDQLSMERGIVLRGHRIVVPRPLRRKVLNDLHASHQGQVRTKRRARQTVYWPHICNDIDNMVRNCSECRKRLPSLPKEPMLPEAVPDLPFQSVGADLFSCEGYQFLVYVDRLSGWPCVAKMGRSANTKDVIKPIRRWFADVGVPQILRTDGGPQFASRQFEEFCRRWQVTHQRSTPHYPQSNGLAEAAVKTIKQLLYKTAKDGDLDLDSFQRGLLELRNTPGLDGRSPAQILYGRPISSFVMANHRAFLPSYQVEADKADLARSVALEKSRNHYDQSAHRLSNIPIGSTVDVQDHRTGLWKSTGIVVAIGRNRDYIVKLPSGRAYWRNRRFLRPYVPSVPCHTSGIADSHTQPTRVDVPKSSDHSKLDHIVDKDNTDLVNTPLSYDNVPTRQSTRAKKQYVPFNITSTSGQSYD